MAGDGRHRLGSVAGGSSLKRRRLLGFWIFLLSNVLWVVWGLYTRAWALVFLQVCLAAMNIRGAKKAEPAG